MEMIETVVVLALAAVLWGWLCCSPSAHLFDPLTDRFRPWVEDRTSVWVEVEETWRTEFWDWVTHRLDCPICMGFDATVVASFMLGWQGWDSVALIAAANGLHVAWMTWLNKEE